MAAWPRWLSACWGCCRRASHQPVGPPAQRALLAREAQRPQPQDGVDAHLGHDGKERRHRRTRRRIGRHQPEAHRPDGRLGKKGHAQDGHTGMQHGLVLRRHLGNAHGQVGHVQRTRDAIQHGRAHQEEGRGHQVDGDVVQPRPHPLAAGPMQQQAVGSRQQHLEEHEQVEEITREEGPVQAHQLDLEERMEMHADPVPAGHRKDEGRRGHDRGKQQHGRRQPVQHQHDAERRGPVGRQIDAQRADGPRRLPRRGRCGAVVHRPGQQDG